MVLKIILGKMRFSLFKTKMFRDARSFPGIPSYPKEKMKSSPYLAFLRKQQTPFPFFYGRGKERYALGEETGCSRKKITLFFPEAPPKKIYFFLFFFFWNTLYILLLPVGKSGERSSHPSNALFLGAKDSARTKKKQRFKN